MPNKRKSKENIELSSHSQGLPKTFRELTQLTNSELNTLVRLLDLPLKQKRNHKLTVVAQHLNITTVGDDNDQDPFLQTLADVKGLTDGWTSDIRSIPDIDITTIKKYLLAAHDITVPDGKNEKFTDSNLKTYKATRAFDLWESGHLSGFRFNELKHIDGYSAVKCLANPSGDTSGTQYDVIVIFKEGSGPIGASCTCVAGLGEACTHIAGLMFGVEDFVSRGFKELSDGPSTTEILCKWSVPRGPAVTPMQLNKLSIKKNVPGKITREKTFSAATYNPLPEEKQKVNFDHLTKLHHTLGIVNPRLPWVKAVAPAIVAQHKTLPISKGASHLPDIIGPDNHLLIPAKLCQIETNKNPPTLSDKIKVQFSGVINRDELKYSIEECNTIEKITKKQSQTPDWFKYRLGLITASKFHQVESHIKTMKKKGITSSTNTLVEMFVKGAKFKGNSVTRYGQQQEPLAVDVYYKEMSHKHINLKIEESGLVLSEEFPYLGASPDRIVSCLCHGKRILEVKCPYSLVDKTRSIESMDFLQVCTDSKCIILKKTGNSYYDQVQGQMGVTGIKQCDFVVFDGIKVLSINVSFDETYWKAMALRLDQFHQKHVFPALIESVRGRKHHILSERRCAQNKVSNVTKMFPCGKCGKLLANRVTDNNDASIQCECNCGCQQWYHWRCVNYAPDPDNFDEEPAWYCVSCVRMCDMAV